MKTIRDVLSKYENSQDSLAGSGLYTQDMALADIKSIVLGWLPKKEVIKSSGEQMYKACGRNEAIAEMRERINESN